MRTLTLRGESDFGGGLEDENCAKCEHGEDADGGEQEETFLFPNLKRKLKVLLSK